MNDTHLDLLPAVAAGEFTYSRTFANGYLHNGQDCGYKVHNGIAQLHVHDYVTYDETVPVTTLVLTNKGREAMP